MRRKWGVAVITLLTLGLIAGCASNDKVAKEIKTASLKEQVSCHDPQIIVGKDGKYYMFGSHTVGVKSDTLSGWEYFANGNNLFLISILEI